MQKCCRCIYSWRKESITKMAIKRFSDRPAATNKSERTLHMRDHTNLIRFMLQCLKKIQMVRYEILIGKCFELRILTRIRGIKDMHFHGDTRMGSYATSTILVRLNTADLLETVIPTLKLCKVLLEKQLLLHCPSFGYEQKCGFMICVRSIQACSNQK